jgi:hypothetical protein
MLPQLLDLVSRLGFSAILVSLFGYFPSAAETPARVVHVFVALADNQHQGIIPVPAKLGDGEVPSANLYWGAAYGVKTYFRTSSAWELVWFGRGPKRSILERCVFRYRKEAVCVVADAYEESQIREAVSDFLSAAAGLNPEALKFESTAGGLPLLIGGGSDLVAYAGHDAFMDFQVPHVAERPDAKPRSAIVLACASKAYFAPYLRDTGANPLLWTTGHMAPEAYTLKAALDGWIAREDGEAIRLRAAHAYESYQHCGLRAAERLIATGW